MDWNDLRFVLAVMRGRTLVNAAASLDVAHTTVGRRLKALEQQLSVRLFDRTPDGLVPTVAGEELAQVAERIEGEILSAEGRVLGRDARLQGSLKVSTIDVAFCCLSDTFESFMARYPSIELDVSISSEQVSLTRREADVVLRLSNSPHPTLVGHRLGHVQFGAYASRELVQQVGEGAPLGAYPWIGWNGGPHRPWFEEWLAHNAPGARIALRLQNQGLVMEHAVERGMGAQLLSCMQADSNPRLRRITPLDPTFRMDLWLLTLPDLRSNIRIRAFMDHMAVAIRAHRPSLEGTAPQET